MDPNHIKIELKMEALDTVGELRSFLADVLNRMGDGTVDADLADAIALAAGAQINQCVLATVK
jgi:hypothetical protein